VKREISFRAICHTASPAPTATVMTVAWGLPPAKRCALLEAVAAELRDRPHFSDADLDRAARAALAAATTERVVAPIRIRAKQPAMRTKVCMLLVLQSIRSIKATAVSNALIDYREMGGRDYPVIRFRAVLDARLPIPLRHFATTFQIERFS
jgi:hypothetical protein